MNKANELLLKLHDEIKGKLPNDVKLGPWFAQELQGLNDSEAIALLCNALAIEAYTAQSLAGQIKGQDHRQN